MRRLYGIKYYQKSLIALALAIALLASLIALCGFKSDIVESKLIIESREGNITPCSADISDNEIPNEIGNAEALIKVDDDAAFVQGLVANTKGSVKDDASEREVDAAIARHRSAMRTHFTARNNFVAQKLGVDKSENTVVSSYSPYISVNYDSRTITDSELRDLEKISRSKYVDKIYLHNKVESKEQGAIVEFGKEVDIKDYVKPGSLTGSGITIGIMESGIADKDNPNYSGLITVKKKIFDKVTDHASMVASIAAGKEGVASSAKILSISATNLVSDFNWLYDNGVDVLNCSYGYIDYKHGEYTSESAFFDYQVENNMLPIVVAAGNYSKKNYESHYVYSPANAYNVLTVGASSYNDFVPDFSCWKTNGLSKPNIVAPTHYKIPNTFSQSEVQQGTSFSAPMVTGIIALLMQYKPSIKLHHDQISSALMTTATAMPHYLDAEASGLNAKAGAGIVNFERAKEVIERDRSIQTVTGDAPGEKAWGSLILSANQTVQASVVTFSSGDYKGTSNELNYYKLYLLDALTNKVVAQSSGDGNVQFLRYTAAKTSLFKIAVDLRNTAVKYDQGAFTYYVFK